MVQHSKAASTIHHVRDPQGTLLVKNEDIAKEFESFYSKLYNLQSNLTAQNTSETCTELIKDFLSQYSPKPITLQQSLDLEGPISAIELEIAIK